MNLDSFALLNLIHQVQSLRQALRDTGFWVLCTSAGAVPAAFPSPMDAQLRGLRAFTLPGQWWLIKGPLPLPKGKMKKKEAQEIKSLNSSSTEDCLPDPDLILTHKQALLTAVTPGLGLQESTKQVINFAHISYAIRLCTLWAPAALALKL